MADIQDTLKEKFNSLLESANSLRQSATESLKETFESGKEKIQELDRDRRANEIYRALGRKVYKLTRRGEIELPECCDKFIESLKELYASEEVDDSDDACCEDGETCCCDDKKDCCCDDKKDCCCDDKKDDDAENKDA